jgi:superoxide dismutase, Fe-Mn family
MDKYFEKLVSLYESEKGKELKEEITSNKKFELPQLPYPISYLEPIIDSKTMEIHHGKHHRAYVDKLNEAINKHSELSYSGLDDLLLKLESLPEDIKDSVRNNGGGHFNHSLFWRILTSEKDYADPSQELSSIINRDFGSFDSFKKEFTEAAKSRFGSGWAWLIVKDNKLKVISTPNQDSPLSEGKPLLGLDVWEHAYYLNYQNKRSEYIDNFFKIINWKAVEENLK